MKLITFITILSFSILSCTNEKPETPTELTPERQEEFEREDLDIQQEQEQRGRTSEALHQEAQEEELD